LSFRNIGTVKRCGKIIERKQFINLPETFDAMVDYFSIDQKSELAAPVRLEPVLLAILPN
jgi:hypothetical protein